MASGWSTKALIREIMLTRAYAMSSAFDAADAAKDPDNTYLWRMPKKRLEAEAIRDSMLRAAGLLDLAAPTASPVAHLEGSTRAQGQARNTPAVDLSGAGSNHRSVYLPIVRDRVPEGLEVFDFAEPSFVTGRRDATNVPTQALYLMNSAEVTRISDAFARRVLESAEKEPERIAAVFELALGRAPTASEIRACRDFLDDFAAELRKDAPAQQAPQRAGSMRERVRQRMAEAAAARRDGGTAASARPNAETSAYSALCQAVLLSAEFRTVD